MKSNLIYILFWTALLLPKYNSLAGQFNDITKNYFLNPSIINPAMAGSEFFPVIYLSAGKQWLGFEHSPSVEILSTSLRIGNFDFYNPKMFLNKSNLRSYERIGIAANIYNVMNGPLSNRGGNFSYAYHIPINKSRLAFGISGKLDQYTFDQTEFKPVSIIDPLLDFSRESIFSFTSSIGALFYNSSYFLGLSGTNIFANKLNINPLYKRGIQYWIHGGYLFKDIGDLNIEPSVYINLQEEFPVFYDFNLKIYYKYINWIAITYRSYHAVKIRFGIKAKQLYIAYSYELSTSRIALYNFGSHELGLGINLGVRRLQGF